MSEHGFHVHGPHDHELEHAAHSSLDSFAGRLAIVTAILATVGATFSFMSGSTESESLRLENEASIRRSEADSQWARVLTTSGELNVVTLAIELVPEARKAHFQTEADRLATERDATKLVAERLDAAAIALDVESDDQLRLHHRWAQGTTVLQISIAMAAIALLTKRRWLQYGVYSLGALGTVLGVMAWLHV
jgi:hypothetical protein